MMIASVRGTMERIGIDHVVVQVGGFGIKVYVPASELPSVDVVGSQTMFFTTLVLREDSVDLYGFSSAEGKKLFETLISVNGVGPRLALSALSVMSPQEIATAILTSDSGVLARVPGIGKRIAGRIILDLQARVEQEWGIVATSAQQAYGDLVAALAALGYSSGEVQRVVAALGDISELNLEGQLRLALQKLAGDEML